MDNKIKENEQQITYFKLENLLKRAYKSKAKISDDPIHEEVNCTIYCGAGFNVGVTATSYEDPDTVGKVCFYASQQYEDEIGEMSMGEDLEQTIKDLFQMASDISEMEERPYIDDAEIRKLEDIANGQSLLFENKMDKTMNNRIKELKDNFVVVELLDFEDDEVKDVLESYGGQLDYDVWSISKENIQDIKEEIDDWKNRIAFYSSYDDGRYGKKLTEKEVFKSYLKDSSKRLWDFPSAEKNFKEFCDKLQDFCDTYAKGMGLVVDGRGLNGYGADIHISQEDEYGRLGGYESWLDSDDLPEWEELYKKTFGEEDSNESVLNEARIGEEDRDTIHNTDELVETLKKTGKFFTVEKEMDKGHVTAEVRGHDELTFDIKIRSDSHKYMMKIFSYGEDIDQFRGATKSELIADINEALSTLYGEKE